MTSLLYEIQENKKPWTHRGWWAETGEGSQKVETPNYKVNKSRAYNLQQSDCS